MSQPYEYTKSKSIKSKKFDESNLQTCYVKNQINLKLNLNINKDFHLTKEIKL